MFQLHSIQNEHSFDWKQSILWREKNLKHLFVFKTRIKELFCILNKHFWIDDNNSFGWFASSVGDRWSLYIYQNTQTHNPKRCKCVLMKYEWVCFKELSVDSQSIASWIIQNVAVADLCFGCLQLNIVYRYSEFSVNEPRKKQHSWRWKPNYQC